MRLSPRAQMALGASGAALLAGVLGLAWWLWRHRPGREPGARLRRLGPATGADLPPHRTCQ